MTDVHWNELFVDVFASIVDAINLCLAKLTVFLALVVSPYKNGARQDVLWKLYF